MAIAPPKTKSKASTMMVVSFDQQCDTNSKEYPAQNIGIESRRRIRDTESGDKAYLEKRSAMLPMRD